MAASRSVAITYVPADCGSVIPGKSKAPQAFRDVGTVDRLRRAGVDNVSEHHALEAPATYAMASFEPGGVRNQDVNIDVCGRVHRTIARNLMSSSSLSSSASSRPPFQLILGGECCMSPAIVAAFWQHAQAQSPPLRVGLIYIDADTDLASPTDPSSTGIFAGMNMTHLLGRDGALPAMKEQFSRPSSGAPVCDASNIVLFGINMTLPGNRPEHFGYLFDNGYQVISAASVARDPEQRARKALEYLDGTGVDVILVHLDVDSIDPQMFPLANVPNFTGVTFEQMMRALKVLLASDKVAALTVAEVNPDHDPGLEMVDRLTGEIVGMLGVRGERK